MRLSIYYAGCMFDIAGESQSNMSRLQPKSPRTRPYKTFVIGPDLNADFMMEAASNQTSSGDVSPSVSGRGEKTLRHVIHLDIISQLFL